MHFGIVLFGFGNGLFLWLKKELVQPGLSELRAVLVSHLKHGKSSAFPPCACETNNASKRDL